MAHAAVTTCSGTPARTCRHTQGGLVITHVLAWHSSRRSGTYNELLVLVLRDQCVDHLVLVPFCKRDNKWRTIGHTTVRTRRPGWMVDHTNHPAPAPTFRWHVDSPRNLPSRKIVVADIDHLEARLYPCANTTKDEGQGRGPCFAVDAPPHLLLYLAATSLGALPARCNPGTGSSAALDVPAGPRRAAGLAPSSLAEGLA